MTNYLTTPSAAARVRSQAPFAVSPSALSGWCTPGVIAEGSAPGTAGFGYGTHEVSVAQMSANAVLDARPAAKQNRPPRGVPR
jgi:hypothetical protein